MHQELLAKKETYASGINFAEKEIEQLEGGFSKLEHTKNLYLNLHRRTVLKSSMLVWRHNAQKILHSIKQSKRTPTHAKISLKSILSILNPKY